LVWVAPLFGLDWFGTVRSWPVSNGLKPWAPNQAADDSFTPPLHIHDTPSPPASAALPRPPPHARLHGSVSLRLLLSASAAASIAAHASASPARLHTRDSVVRHRVETLSMDTILYQR